jgi:hypothetical protein
MYRWRTKLRSIALCPPPPLLFQSGLLSRHCGVLEFYFDSVKYLSAGWKRLLH